MTALRGQNALDKIEGSHSIADRREQGVAVGRVGHLSTLIDNSTEIGKLDGGRESIRGVSWWREVIRAHGTLRIGTASKPKLCIPITQAQYHTLKLSFISKTDTL